VKVTFGLRLPAYNNAHACYDREYLFQFSEWTQRIHTQALAQVRAAGSSTAGAGGCSLDVATEPYHPSYFMINGRSMPDDMDPNYAFQYPHQPYNGNPHMHPGEQVLYESSAPRAGGNIPSTSDGNACAQSLGGTGT